MLKPVQRPPKGEREVIFYETVFDEAEERSEILQLRRFLPHYYGVVQLGILKPNFFLTLLLSKVIIIVISHFPFGFMHSK